MHWYDWWIFYRVLSFYVTLQTLEESALKVICLNLKESLDISVLPPSFHFPISKPFDFIYSTIIYRPVHFSRFRLDENGEKHFSYLRLRICAIPPPILRKTALLYDLFGSLFGICPSAD